MPPSSDDRKTTQVTFKLDDEEAVAGLEQMAKERSKAEGKGGREGYSRNTLARQLVVDAVASWRAGSEGAAGGSTGSVRGVEADAVVVAAIEELGVRLLAGMTHGGAKTTAAVERLGGDVLQLRRDITTVMMNLLIHSGHKKETAAEIAYDALKPKTS